MSGWPLFPGMTPVPYEASEFAVNGRERQTTDGGGSRGSRRRMECAVVLTSRDKGFVPYLRLHPLLSLKKWAQKERKREKAGGYYGGAEAKTKCQGGGRKKYD